MVLNISQMDMDETEGIGQLGIVVSLHVVENNNKTKTTSAAATEHQRQMTAE